MVRRYVNKQLFDVLPDGTMVPIIQVVPPRNLLNPILKQAVTTADVIQEFLLNFVGIQVALPGIEPSIPPIEPPTSVVIVPISETPVTSTPPDSGPPTSTNPPSEQSPGSGEIRTRFGVPPSDVESAIMTYWPQRLWVSAAEISNAESSWSNAATNDTRSRGGGQCGVRYYLASAGIWAYTELSLGIFQINMCAHGGSESEWRDPNNNARKGYELYLANGDFSAWAYSARKLGLPQHIL